MSIRRVRWPAGPVLATAVALVAAACADRGTAAPETDDRSASLQCSIPLSGLLPGGPGKDGIPALTDPELVTPASPDADYLANDDRVIGVRVGGRAFAIPLNIMWWHEVVNITAPDVFLAVTHCPLTGSTLAFDRAAVGNAELGVSGLLFKNNLVMYDRTGDESLWPQMLRGARCGSRDGTDLDMYPVIETTWAWWQVLHPETRVVSSRTGYGRDYTRYPYGDYAEPNNSQTLFPMPPLDTRRPPKERVLGIAVDEGGIGFPFGALADAGIRVAEHVTVGGRPVVVLWDGRGQAAMAFESTNEGESLTFDAVDHGFRDRQTGSLWRVDGRAVSGPRAGDRLEPVPEAYVAYWFAWAEFQPDAALWEAP